VIFVVDRQWLLDAVSRVSHVLFFVLGVALVVLLRLLFALEHLLTIFLDHPRLHNQVGDIRRVSLI
jgi:hypothetical protein